MMLKKLFEKECGFVFLNREEKIIHANRGISLLYGYSNDEIIGKKIGALRIKRISHDREIHRRKDGTNFEVKIFPVIFGKTKILFICKDVENYLFSLMDNAQIGALLINENEEIIYLNEKSMKLTGWDEKIIGKKISLLLPEKRKKSIFNSPFNELQILQCKNGHSCKTLTFSIVFDKHALIFFEPIEENELLKRLNFMAYHDELTSLPTHALLVDRISQAFKISKRTGEKVAILFLDLDGFKRINDTFSHRRGDLVLKRISQRLKSIVREMDTVARIGGDEFVITLRVKNVKGVTRVINEIIKGISKPITIGNHRVSLSASIGVSFYPDDGNDIEELIHKADMAMYSVKTKGKGGYAFYRDAINKKIKSENDFKKEITRALQKGEFELYYQPIVETSTLNIIGAEALIRWHHPERGLILPNEFIPFAEENNLIKQIGKWVVEQACKDIKFLNEHDIHIFISLNVSASQLQDSELLYSLIKNIRESSVTPENLILELTEKILMRENLEAKSMIDELKRIGIKVALDNFGTDYSNLKHLSSLPLDILKIDRSFVKDIPNSSKDAKIAQTVVLLGKSLEIMTIAEGIEKKEEFEALKKFGCDAAQGYLFSPALKLEKFVNLCQKKIKPFLQA